MPAVIVMGIGCATQFVLNICGLWTVMELTYLQAQREHWGVNEEKHEKANTKM